jgi:hypothetical protein
MGLSGQFHVPAALPPGREPQVSIWEEAGWATSQPGRGNEEKNSQPLPEIESRSSSP